ncbi:MAG: hypothetical protein J6T01_05795 [Kiritimatiellae bacterium]|nr:hypothetical protein [Kiritimatiellia bacterium]
MTARGVYRFKVRSYECGADGLATLPTVCNYLQEAASLHAEHLGFSKSDFDAAGGNVSWVLTRLAVKIKRYPAWEEEVSVETFPRGGVKLVAWRDFEVKDSSGAVVAAASSEWMIINLATRKIAQVPDAVAACCDPANEPVLGDAPFSRLKFRGEALGSSRFTALKGHIDLNGHVNNVHYIEWMLEPCEDTRPAEMEVVFRSETFAGEEVLVETARDDGFIYHRVFSADGKDHIVARTKR